MEIDILRLINEGIHPGVLALLKSTALLAIILAIVVVPAYLAGLAWLCIKEIRSPLPRRIKPAPGLPNSDQPEMKAVLAALDESPVDDLKTDLAGGSQTFPSRRWKPSLRQVSGVPR